MNSRIKTEVSFVSCHVLYCGNAKLSPTEILVSLSFSYSEILLFLETILDFSWF